MFSSGYTANLGAVVALSGPGSLLVSDALTHASLVDACRLSRARVVVTPHRDVAAVEAALAARDEERAVVVTDSVFSADGVLAPLRALHDVCRRHGALLIVDEAHGLGVRGTGGRGLLHEVGPGRCARRGDDHDAVQGAGQPGRRGARAGRGARPPDRRRAAVHLRHRAGARRGRRGVGRAAGADRRAVAARRPCCDHAAALAEICGVAERPESAVVSVILGEPEVALAAATACLDRGVRVGCFRPPTVPAGTSRLRLTARASLSDDEMALARAVLTEVLSPARPQAAVSVLVVTGHRHRRRQDGRHRGAGVSRAAGRHRRRGVQAGADRQPPGDDDLAEVARLSGVTELHGAWRYPEPLAPAAAAQRAGLPLPTRGELVGARSRRTDRGS